MQFYLGTHSPCWLWQNEPLHRLFISHRRLARYKNFQQSNVRWALDSGGFTELNLFGGWRTTAAQYVSAIRRYQNEIGSLDWAAQQDWMCEPQVLKKTGKTIAEHQQLTIRNFLQLREIDACLPIIPTLQGWQVDDYLRHVEMYERAGVNLESHALVGMGTFCRRANLAPVHHLVKQLHLQNIKMHGFGVKTDGLRHIGHLLKSADSLAWSLTARLSKSRLCSETHKAKKCNNCRAWAHRWADKTVLAIGTAPFDDQLELF